MSSFPENVSYIPLKYVCSVNVATLPENTPDGLEIEYIDISAVDALGAISKPETITFERAPSRARRIVHNGDVLISTVRTYLKAIAHVVRAEDNLICSTGFAVLSAGASVVPRFLFYWVRSEAFVGEVVSRSVGVSYPAINPGEVMNLPFPQLALRAQAAIAEFLDRELVRLDDLIAKKRRLIELLNEKRNALIARATTQGLDPSAPMKDSGVPWLGPVPKHWEVKRLGKFCFLQRGHDLPEQDREIGDVPILSSAGVSGHHIRAAAHGPAVVTGRYGSIGQVFYVDGPFWPLNTTLYSVSLFGNDARYVKFMVEQLPLASDSEKSAVPGVNRNHLHTLEVACPPIDEQAPIGEVCLSTVGNFRALSDAVQVAMDLLREYRSALITAAVTGQLDLRDHEKKMEALA